MSIRIGKYSVIQPLGTGGMAEVFKCRLSGIGGFDKVVVVKRLLPHLAQDTEFVRMFLDEARLTANLNHPNVVQVYEIDEVDGIPYMAMEYVHGPTLWALMRLLRRKPEQRHLGHLAKVLAGVSAGLHWAHNAHDADGEALGIIHRDVSPQNILITLTGLPKLCDFGVAKARGRLATTQAGTLKGKFKYIAPEQVRSDLDIDYRADVFSAGVCLFEATTGQLPFRGESEAQLIHSVASGHYAKPSSFSPDYPAELEKIVLWTLEADRDRRCPSAKHLQDALETFVSKPPFQSSQPEVAGWLRDLFADAQSGAFRVAGATTPDWAKAAATEAEADSNAAPTLAQRISSGGARLRGSRRFGPRRVWFGLTAGLLALFGAALLFFWPRAPSSVTVKETPPASSIRPNAGQERIYERLSEVEQLLGQGEWSRAQRLFATIEVPVSQSSEVRARWASVRQRIERGFALQRARELLRAGNAAAALDEAQNGLKSHPDDSEWLILAAEAKRSLEPPTPASEPTNEPTRSQRSPSKMARLSVLADPPAAVSVDRKPLGKTPLKGISLKDGKHEVQVSLPGYVSQRRVVSVARGRDSELSFVLAPAPPRLAMSNAKADDAGASKAASPSTSDGTEQPIGAQTPGSAAASESRPSGDGIGVAANAAQPTKPKEAAVGPGKPRLPATYEARSISDLVHALGVIESEVIARGGVSPAIARQVTAPLAEDLMSTYAPGETLELYPKATYYLVVQGASDGKDHTTIANEIRQAQRQGRLRAQSSRGE